MKVLKFTLSTELPEIEYIEEALGFDDSFFVSETNAFFSESIGLSDLFQQIFEEQFTENLGFESILLLILEENISENIGFDEVTYEYNWADAFENLGLSDSVSEIMTYYIELNENIGFTDGGYVYKLVDFSIVWRTRTKKATYGYGATLYGEQTSYGDGDVIDELKEFKVKVIRLSDDSLLRTDTITIVNPQYPDGSAQYVYTVAMNISDNGYFEPNLRFEIYQVDVNDVWSPGKYIDITITDSGGDFE